MEQTIRRCGEKKDAFGDIKATIWNTGRDYKQEETWYLLFSHGMTEEIDGAICAAKLKDDFSDGPFVVKEKDVLKMTWSSWSDGGYGMIFTTREGRKRLLIHTPNETPLERPKFIDLE